MTKTKTTKAEREIAMVESQLRHFERHELPQKMWGGVRRYLLYGVCTGDFLKAVIENSLARAAAHADVDNQPLLFDWASFMYNGMPIGSWGSVEQMNAWADKGGLLGMEEAREKEPAS